MALTLALALALALVAVAVAVAFVAVAVAVGAGVGWLVGAFDLQLSLAEYRLRAAGLRGAALTVVSVDSLEVAASMLLHLRFWFVRVMADMVVGYST